MRTPFVMSGSSPVLSTVQTAAFPLICASSTGRQKVDAARRVRSEPPAARFRSARPPPPAIPPPLTGLSSRGEAPPPASRREAFFVRACGIFLRNVIQFIMAYAGFYLKCKRGMSFPVPVESVSEFLSLSAAMPLSLRFFMNSSSHCFSRMTKIFYNSQFNCHVL